MLGKYNAVGRGRGGIGFREAMGLPCPRGLRGLGQNPLDTVKQTLRTTEDVLPAVEVMAEDYVKVSPFINFLADYWAVALVITAATVAVGSAVGSWTVLKRLEKK